MAPFALGCCKRRTATAKRRLSAPLRCLAELGAFVSRAEAIFKCLFGGSMWFFGCFMVVCELLSGEKVLEIMKHHEF